MMEVRRTQIEMRKPHFVMPRYPDVTDRVIAREFDNFNELLDRKGWDAAHMAAINQLCAVTCWLDQLYGSRRSYELFQKIADQLISPELGSVE
jgi:hypothetical protein